MEYLAKIFDNKTNTWKDKLDVSIPNWGMTYPVMKQLDLALRGINGEEEEVEEESKEINVEKRGVADHAMDEVLNLLRSANGYYNKLVDTFVKLGYTENKDIVSAPYDWRNQPYEKWMADTKKKIEEVTEDGKRKAVLVAHSYGNIMTYLFLINQDQDWKDKHIHHYVAASPAYMGSPKAFVLGLTYTILDISPKSPIYMKAMGENFRNIPSLYTLMPYSKAYTSDPYILEVKDKKYTMDDIPIIFNEVGVKNFDAKWNVSRFMMKRHNEEYSITPGVKTTLFYTTSKTSTYYKVVCPTKTLEELKEYKDWVGSRLCVIKFKEGDGTVTKDSLLYPCDRWNDKENGICQSIEIKEADHTSLIKMDDFLKGVGNIAGVDYKELSDILSYDTLVIGKPKLFGKYILESAKWSTLILAIFSLGFFTLNIDDWDKIIIFLISLIAFIAFVIYGCCLIGNSLEAKWLYVNYDGDVLKFSLEHYHSHGIKKSIESLENCDTCEGIQKSGKFINVSGIAVIVIMVVAGLLSIAGLCLFAADKDFSFNFPLGSLLANLVSIVLVIFGAYDYINSVAELSIDGYQKSYAEGLPCFISSVICIFGALIPNIVMAITTHKEKKKKNNNTTVIK